MGTVGLSFGSPTSGQGFDVSSTVASIISNLQNVETPWKSQLTTLNSQDTAISSLGTLFSNLSNDMSALTDLQGIMAQKEGSSSDQNVLTLTAANSTATAGTHTVEVQSLAQTSSGYLAPVTGSSQTLSGSITVQVGSGTAYTISVPTSSGDNTLTGLASAINSSGAGITANVIPTSEGSILSLVSGTSGAAGNITVTSGISGTNQILGYNATTGSTTNGSLTAVGSSTDTLSGSISIQAGNGATENIVMGAPPTSGSALNTIYTGSGADTLADLQGTIANAGLSVTASLNSSGTVLTLDSGSNGTLAVSSNIVDSNPSTLGYISTVTGADAKLTVDGIPDLTSSSNTVANLIPGVTFQLLAPSARESDSTLEQVQVVIANDNAGVESAVSSVVSDYNALISALNTQEGEDSSGNPEPLFGSPTLSLLQQQLLGGLNVQNPNGYLDATSNDTDTTLAGSIVIQAGSGTAQTVVVGPVPSGGAAANTIYTGSGSDWNTLSGLVAAINGANSTLTYSDAGNTAATVDRGVVGPAAIGDSLSGSITIAAGSGNSQTINVPTTTGNNTLAGLEGAINDAGIGVTASVVDNGDGTQSLSILSQTTGSAGALTVTSSVTDSTANAGLSYSDSGYVAAIVDSGVVSPVANSGNSVFGSMTITVGSGPVETVVVGAAPNTGAAANTFYTGSANGDDSLSGLANAINTSGIGVSATVVTNSDGTSSLSLVSQAAGAAGELLVQSEIAEGIGVTAGVATSGTQSTLTLASQTAGSAGAVSVNSSIKATSATPLSYWNSSPYTASAPDGGLIGGFAGSDVLSGSVIVQVGGGPATTIQVPSSNATLAGLAGAINAAKLGVTATPIESSNGGWSISLVSGTDGSAGKLSITASLLDTTNTTTSTLNYTNSSDISTLANLGITISDSDNGTVAFDATSLDSVLNSDYSGVVGFFQNANSWGMMFSNTLTNSGSSSGTGVLALAASSNSSIESTLNADISKENSLISVQQISLTAELNSANEIMQQLPSQLQGVNELYSAITGYDQNLNG